MGLKAFHIVFVSASSLLAFTFCGWCFHSWRVTEQNSWLATGIGSLVAGVALIVYGIWFWRKITTDDEERKRRRKMIHPVRTVLILFGMWILDQPAAWACGVCYGDAEGPMIDAARWGIFLLFGLVGVVQISFATFFITLWRRARKEEKKRSV